MAKRSPGRPPVPLDKILATALQILDEEGAEALSMRTLAQRLGSGTATLYRHFDNRAALIAHVIDRMFAEAEPGSAELAEMGWQEACRTVARTMFAALTRYRNLAPLLVEQIPIGPNAMALRERLLAVLLAEGFPPHLAARFYAMLSRFVLGFAIQVSGHAAPGQPDDAQLASIFHGLGPSVFPATTAAADALPVPLDEEFGFGLELILAGLAQLRDNS